MGDFYNTNIDVKYLGNPQTFETHDIKMLDLNRHTDDDTMPGNSNISGTDSAYTIKSHFYSCQNSRVLGSFKARKYIFPRQDKKHPGYFAVSSPPAAFPPP